MSFIMNDDSDEKKSLIDSTWHSSDTFLSDRIHHHDDDHEHHHDLTTTSMDGDSTALFLHDPPDIILDTPSDGSMNESERDGERENVSLWRIVALSSWQVGLTMSWNAMFQTSTPLFKSLGLDPLSVSLANLAGPLSGLIFQPICGVISDQSRAAWGRRRPFVLGGTLLALAGMLLFAYPTQLAALLAGSSSLSVAIALVGLWVMNIGLNVVQGPAWALIYDQLPPHQQPLGNSVVNVLGAAAGLLGSLLGAAPLTSFLPFLASQSLALFWFAILFLLASVAPTLLFANEIPLTSSIENEEKEEKEENEENENEEKEEKEEKNRKEEEIIERNDQSALLIEQVYSNPNQNNHPHHHNHDHTDLYSINPTQSHHADQSTMDEETFHRIETLNQLLNQSSHSNHHSNHIDTIQSNNNINNNINNNDNDNENDNSCIGSMKRMWRASVEVFRQIFVVGVGQMSEQVFWILAVYFFVNCASSPSTFYGTDYFGEVVYHGSPDPASYLYPQYERGVRMGALGFALSGLVQIASALLLPLLVRRAGFRPVWLAAQLSTAAVLLLLVLAPFQTLATSMAFVAVLGVGTATAGVVPFAMVGMLDDTREKAGLMIALLNSAQVVAQAVAIFASGVMVSLTGNVASGVAIGGGFGIVALFITAMYMTVPKVSNKTIF